MKKAIIFVLLSLCGLSVQAQDWVSKLRATVVEPASVPAETGVVKHPWTGKKVLFIGDSITDPRDKHNIDRHYYDWLSDWLGITAYVRPRRTAGQDLHHAGYQRLQHGRFHRGMV